MQEKTEKKRKVLNHGNFLPERRTTLFVKITQKEEKKEEKF